MIIIESIKDYSEVETREYTDKKTGELKKMYSQLLYVHLGNAFPEKMNVSIESPDKALPIGKYNLSPSSFRVGQYDRLELDGFNLASTLVKVS